MTTDETTLRAEIERLRAENAALRKRAIPEEWISLVHPDDENGTMIAVRLCFPDGTGIQIDLTPRSTFETSEFSQEYGEYDAAIDHPTFESAAADAARRATAREAA